MVISIWDYLHLVCCGLWKHWLFIFVPIIVYVIRKSVSIVSRTVIYMVRCWIKNGRFIWVCNYLLWSGIGFGHLFFSFSVLTYLRICKYELFIFGYIIIYLAWNRKILFSFVFESIKIDLIDSSFSDILNPLHRMRLAYSRPCRKGAYCFGVKFKQNYSFKSGKRKNIKALPYSIIFVQNVKKGRLF